MKGDVVELIKVFFAGLRRGLPWPLEVSKNILFQPWTYGRISFLIGFLLSAAVNYTVDLDLLAVVWIALSIYTIGILGAIIWNIFAYTIEDFDSEIVMKTLFFLRLVWAFGLGATTTVLLLYMLG